MSAELAKQNLRREKCRVSNRCHRCGGALGGRKYRCASCRRFYYNMRDVANWQGHGGQKRLFVMTCKDAAFALGFAFGILLREEGL
jgi:hypothetical protein